MRFGSTERLSPRTAATLPYDLVRLRVSITSVPVIVFSQSQPDTATRPRKLAGSVHRGDLPREAAQLNPEAVGAQPAHDPPVRASGALRKQMLLSPGAIPEGRRARVRSRPLQPCWG